MGFAERLLEVRKKRGISQEVLANKLGTQGPAIGRYERGVAKPTIEVAGKLAKLLEVSLDYLVGITDLELDNETQKRILEVQQLSDDDKNNIFYTLDGLIKAAKLKNL
ncbi:MAG: helix-turn-helix transcriptional regulator [Moritella sp.]|uniref:helix-turn-helix domain-containing protein n=1 Tax=Moritella sp. TaxID=78556 RepID=UPI001D20297F|nr:helix-turn-helix transcriptional regulator [Moritella sp.]NQZ51975.1 helix-turn-helix transcriptional regulator [Moritella sp.]